jgi:voltage-gated potassium channel
MKSANRWRLLLRLEDRLETPMLVLGLVWLALLIFEFAVGNRNWIEVATYAIWVVFLVDFGVKFAIAPAKLPFLKKNWLTLLSLAVPALRVFRLLRVARLIRFARMGRNLRLLRVVSSFNRGMKSLQHSLGRKGVGYVLALTVLVVVLGAAGMLAFEKDVPEPGGIHDYGTALWWTAMMATTMGSQYWPQTSEGRILALLLAIYAFAIFGYITATVASFFVDRETQAAGKAGTEMKALSAQIESLRTELRELRTHSRFDEPN